MSTWTGIDRDQPQPLRVVVVGGGAAGTIAAAHLVRAATPATPVHVTLVERSGRFGPGLAYDTHHPLHTVNNFAARLSAVPGDPDHLVRWCRDRGEEIGPTGFVGRGLYGAYLADVLDSADVPDGSALGRVQGTVTDIDERHTVRLADGQTLAADQVVLALGNPPARHQQKYADRAAASGAPYVSDPWAPDLVERARGARRVLLVGTGLTMVDTVAVLHDADPSLRFTAVSRNGLLPQAHAPGSLRLHDIFHPGTTSLSELLESIEQRTRELADIGGDWRDVVDSVRAAANELWQGFTEEEQASFVDELARVWEIARHRMPPLMARHIAHLQSTGVLEVRTREDEPDGPWDLVVNCSGSTPVPTRGWNPLMDRLLDQGVVRPHRLGLGLDLDPDGHPVGRDGRADSRLHVLGAARRGLEWEVTAIPDLRMQAARLADLLVADVPVGREQQA
ncbi:FAD/NAD(P)-binding protein [Nocardioides rotundus]|uniref:FAD/NAD(P)-binding protein n=1 Tax=Nocardioides rotundus TaxID=1774216 RepID=UPI001CC0203E|nr:FAD/NAD(P)-binding protein [Nocardioides rotundus]UAL31486.1 FAD/NAD(P)-binding protein [Nocardioides rotundus]